jgi:hypothetical protein
MCSKYLERYLAALELVCLPEQKTLVVDPNSRFVYLSPAILSDYGLTATSYQQASYSDLPPITQIATSCVAEDRECLTTLQIQQYITSQNHNGEIQLYLKQKTPIISPESSAAVGVRVDFFPIYSLGHFKPYINEHLVSYNSAPKSSLSRTSLKLTELEELILFLLIMYLKPKVVTWHLNTILGKDVAISTIRNTIHQQLMRKFAVTNLDELVDKAIFMGYDTILPRIMVKQFSIRIN